MTSDSAADESRPGHRPIHLALKLCAMGASAVGAVYLGFLAETPQGMLHLQGRLGYEACAFSFAFLMLCLALPARRLLCAPNARILLRVGLLALGLVLLVAQLMPPKARILVDEAQLLGVSFAMAQAGDNILWEESLQLRGNGFQPLSFSYNKRPPGYPFLVSLVHRVSGYRIANAFVVNLLGGALVLLLVFQLARTMGGVIPGLLGMTALASFPLFWASVMSAGFEILNLALILAGFLAARALDRRPSWSHLLLLLALAAAVGLMRYESVVFSALFVAFGLWRAPYRELRSLPWMMALAPLAFVPAAWQLFVPFATEVGQDTVAFSPAHLPVNLMHALRFLLNQGEVLLSAPLTGLAGLCGLILLALRSIRTACGRLVLAGAVFWSVSVFSYWHGDVSRLITARLFLPALALLALGCAELAMVWQRRMVWRGLPAAFAVALLLAAMPFLLATDRSMRSEAGDVFRETAGLVAQAQRQGPILLVSWPGGWFGGLGVGTLEYQNAAGNPDMLETLLAERLVEQILLVDIMDGNPPVPRFGAFQEIGGQLRELERRPLYGGAILRLREWLPPVREAG